MKKIFIALSMLTLLYTACDPSMDDGTTGFAENVTADNVQASVTNIQVDGKATNLFVVENHSPITQQWIAPQLAEKSTLSSKAYDTVYVTKTGANVIQMNCKNTAVNFTKDFPVNVDEIYYLTDELQKRLCIDTEKSKKGNYVSAIKEIQGQKVQFCNTFDQNKLQVIQEIGPNGEKGNKFAVRNENGVLSDWTISNPEIGDASSNLNLDTLLVGDPGVYDLTLKCTKADGTTETVDLGQYTVEKLTTIPELFTYLAGEDGTGTTWEWNPLAGNVWGNGNINSDTKPSWWGVSYDAIDDEGDGKPCKKARNGKDAYFTLDWATKTASSSDGKVTGLKFKVNPLEHNANADAGWDLGTITFEASGEDFVVPMGVDVNHGNVAFQKYYVLKASGKRLVLAAKEVEDNGCGWFYMFRLKEAEE